MTEPAFLDLPDLAAEGVGGAALACNDEFFAEKENLLKPHAAEWKEHLYTDRGKWMDGWETRRRREPGYDWCVVRLGMPGVIRGVVIDTSYFRGNFPESASLEACEIDEPLDLAALARATWTELLPRATLAGHSPNTFAIADERRYTHVRLNIFPDGGVARLRVHGEVRPRAARLRGHGLVDLAALTNGAVVESCSDMFFGSRANLIKPGPSRSMADGWETRRRRGPGHDWALVRLCGAGIVEKLELDTSHFKGNAPGRCLVEGLDAELDSSEALLAHAGWRPLLDSPLQPHTVHVFDEQVRRVGPVRYLRLSVFPDGGVARLRAWGRLAPSASEPRALGVEQLNQLDGERARAELLRCCGSATWAAVMSALRPFEDEAALLRLAEREYWRLSEPDYLEAFAAHPRIGGATGGKGDGAPGWSSQEQRGVAGADAATAAELARRNEAYAERFGFVFLICATGRGAAELLAELTRRGERSRDDELRTAIEEQLQITQLRLGKLLDSLGAVGAPGQAQRGGDA
ncbi:MAG: allantoicase [Kofleriaceae bacterium]